MLRPVLAQITSRLRGEKLTLDISYTLGSFAVLAVSGIVINLAITAFRDAAALGVFNVAYAVYIVASQFAVFGLHYSVLRFAAYHESSPDERADLLCTAGVCVTVLGVSAAAVIYFAEPLFATAFGSEVGARAIRNAALGLTLFPLNKVLLAYLNGLRLMKAFSILQAIRYVAIMTLVTAIAASPVAVENTTWCFLAAEVLTAILAIGFLVTRGLVQTFAVTRRWIRTHFAFGARGLMAGMFSEVNSRVDVLLIGLFLNERAVGIYSFAAMLVDGIYHVLAMVRINFNPMLVTALRDRDHEQARRLRAQSGRYIGPVISALSIALIAVYYAFTSWVMPEKGLQEGMVSMVILAAGLSLVSFLVPFDNLMMVSGHPGLQAVQQLTSVAANVVFAIALLPVLGIEGAAIGTAMSYVTNVAMLLFFARRTLGWNPMSNEFRK